MASDDRLYYEDAYVRDFSAQVTDSREKACRLSETAFYPGGGGQPPDHGAFTVAGRSLAVLRVYTDETGGLWHDVGEDLAVGTQLAGEIEWPRRLALMRRHTLLHIVNALVLREFQGLITGVHIGEDRCSIDFNIPSISPEQRAGLENSINAIITSDLETRSCWIDENEFRNTPSLIRTADVAPPVIGGRVRVISIGDFDAQACGGTHVRRTSEIGLCRITKIDNKGKQNRRFSFSLTPPGK